MNNTFQINRFSKLVKRTFTQHKKTWFLLVIIFMILPIFNTGVLIKNNDKTQYIYELAPLMFLQVFLIISMFAPLILFYNVNHSPKNITEVMLPASTLEKFLNMELFCMVILPFLVFVSYFATNILTSLFYPIEIHRVQESLIGLIKIFTPSSSKPASISANTTYYTGVFFVSQLFFLLNILFTKHKILKIFIFYLIIAFVLTLPLPFRFYREININLMQTSNTISFFVENIAPYILMIASYFVLKAKRY